MVARALGGRVRPNSGATDFAKGDVISPAYLVEAKTTQRKSFPLTHQVLCKIEQEAFAAGKCPVLVVSFETIKQNSQTAPQDWAIIPLSELTALLEKSSTE